MSQLETRPLAASPPRVTVAQANRGKYARWLRAYLFLLPTLLLVGHFLYYPAWTAFTGAFTRWDGFNPPEWVGLANFERALTDPVLRVAARNNLVWTLFEIALAIIPPFIAAELIFHVRSRRQQYWYRTLFVFQMVIPYIVGILLWTYYYRSDGVINRALAAVGLERWRQLWIADPQIALYSLILMGFPWIYAFNLLIFYSGLQNISREVLDAAAVDGAVGLRRIRTIDVPMLRPQLKLLLVLSLIASVQNLIKPLIMTNGGPGYATTVPILYMYETAVTYGQFGYSMAISLLLFVVVLGITIINNRFLRSDGDEA